MGESLPIKVVLEEGTYRISENGELEKIIDEELSYEVGDITVDLINEAIVDYNNTELLWSVVTITAQLGFHPVVFLEFGVKLVKNSTTGHYTIEKF